VPGRNRSLSSRSGAEKWENLSAYDCTICAQWISSRGFTAASGSVTAIMASHTLADASRWLAGQMPQILAVVDGLNTILT
jgi:hypothetical protein